MQAQTDAVRARPKSRVTLSLLLVLLLVAALVPLTPAHADNHMPWDQPGSAWQGSVTTKISRTYTWDPSIPEQTIQAEDAIYTKLVPSGATSDGYYGGFLASAGKREEKGACAGSTGGSMTTNLAKWEANYDASNLLYFETDDTGTTSFLPGLVNVSMADTSYCYDPPLTSHTAGSVLGFESGASGAAAVLNDDDPDPLHLVGTTSWSLSNPPYPLPSAITSYSFTVTYDLRLVSSCPPAVGAAPAVIAMCYAPQVVFHPEEREWPMSIGKFIKNSSLRWSHNKGCRDHELAEPGSVRAIEMGEDAQKPYTHDANRPPCIGSHYGPRYQASAFTRPRDTSSDRLGLEKNEGFFLDLNNKKRSGTPSTSGDLGTYTGSNIYYEYDEADGWIRYYIMYGWSFPPDELLDKIRHQFEVQTGGLSSGPRYVCCHEGEWEGLSIKIDENGLPTHAYYNTHHDGILVEWADVPKADDTHPLAFSALGAHASYPTADAWPAEAGDDVTGNGKVWTTWTQPTALVDVETQPWYGFGGAWGGLEDLNSFLPEFLAVNLVGPLGPSSYMKKTPFQCGLDPQCFPETYRTWP